MQAIKPLSAVNLEVTQANFPALVMALLPSGISGNNLTDSINGVVVTSTQGWTQPASGQFRKGAAGVISVSGTMPVLGTDDFMAVMVGGFVTGTVATALGDTTSGPGIGIRAGASDYVTLDASNYHDVATLTDTTNMSVIAITRTGNTVAKYGYDQSALQAAAAGTPTLDISTAWPALSDTAWAFTDNSNSYYTGIFLFSFSSGLPSAAEIRTSLCWMAANPGKVYPGWYGKE